MKRGFQRPNPKDRGPRTNRRIRVPEVRVIAADGEQLGVMDTRDALSLAEEQGFDLVEVSPTAKPPVCKIMDHGKFKYEQQKKAQANKKNQVKVQVKEVKMRPNTDKHDIEFKMKHARRFLEDKDKVKLTMQFRGREMAFIERGMDHLKEAIQMLKDIGEAEGEPKREGRTLSVILAPAKK
ncbi:MAG: translation initiation factor IF-3 [Deltaproteobacteria bacterium]|nr:translation initiation factor IF-3 [Deltaproteobacteria bacterium]